MICKRIKVHVRPGHLDQYLVAQRIWNEHTARCPGYVGEFVGQSPNEPDVVDVHLYWQSRADLERFMAVDHDRIAALSKAEDHYERIEVTILNAILPGAVSADRDESTAARAGRLQQVSEAFRESAALRVAVRAGVFDLLDQSSKTPADLAKQCGGEVNAWRHLLRALRVLELVESDENDLWRNTANATQFLVTRSPMCQRDMILHNTQPSYITRAFGFAEHIGLAADDAGSTDHALFLSAMSATAAAGQADILMSAIDLVGVSTLIDVGGATGPYSIALCRANPQLNAVILDQPATIPLADKAIAEAGLSNRIRIVEYDYRSSPFPERGDAILFSNVLRGETADEIQRILARARTALNEGGKLIVTDLFVETGSPTASAWRAAMFGIHLPPGTNYTMDEMCEVIEKAGFNVTRKITLSPCVVMNGLIEATPIKTWAST
ncbi:MAG: DUF4937 domain-containing protein [Phycisphaerales bacterium]|nr:DUF4937 domain-containing protein [Phycisphaerales bacterium]